MTVHSTGATAQHAAVRSTVVSGVLLGIGLMGAIDEIVFHQLLQWHNFYVPTTMYWRIVSDGLFHLFTVLMSYVGVVRLWRRRNEIVQIMSGRPFWAGMLLGAGGFQLFDGTVNHKLLRLHPVREGVANIVPYDVGWNAAALALLVAGWLVWRSFRSAQ